MIIGLAGYAQSGKDTAADYLVDKYWYERRAFADVLRSCMAALNPIVSYEELWDEDSEGESVFDVVDEIRYNDALDEIGYTEAKVKYPEVRELLQRFGTEVGRNILGDNIWVEATMRGLDPKTNYVFTDVRFPNEAQAVVSAGGLVVRITRPGVEAANDHASEHSLDDWNFDYFIENDGSIKDLGAKLDDMLRRNR